MAVEYPNQLSKLEPLFSNKCCFCFAIDDNYAKHLGVALVSLRKVANPNFQYDIVVLGNNLSTSNVELLSSIFKNNRNIVIRFINENIPLEKIETFSVGHVNETTYLRFKIFDALSSYEKVFYFDCDIIFIKDPSQLFNVDLKDTFAAAVCDIPFYADMCLKDFNKLPNWEKAWHDEFFNVIKLHDPIKYINDGVVVFNVKKNLEAGINYKKVIEIANERKWCINDQSVLNYLYRGNITPLDLAWNVKPCNIDELKTLLPNDLYNKFSNAIQNPNILHYICGLYPTPSIHDSSNINKYYFECVKDSPYTSLLLEAHDFKINQLADEVTFLSNNLNMVTNNLNIATSNLNKLKKQLEIFQYVYRRSFSKRILRKLFPKNSKLGKILKKARHKKQL